MVAARSYRPKDLKEALKIRNELGAIPYAGGTDLMVKQRRWTGLAPRFQRPVLFIGHLEELRRVECTINAIKISSACTFSDLIERAEVPEVLKAAIIEIGSPGIKNLATIGGNICNASPAGDTLPVLYALDASLVIHNSYGKRTVPIEQFIKSPGRTILQDDELLIQVIIPIEDFNIASYRKVGTRAANALSKLSFVGLGKIHGGRVDDIRLGFGAVAPTVVRSRAIEKTFLGITKKELDNVIPEIRSLYAELVKPINDQRSTARYRLETAFRLLEYFLFSVVREKL